jgi:hypothetical protein
MPESMTGMRKHLYSLVWEDNYCIYSHISLVFFSKFHLANNRLGLYIICEILMAYLQVPVKNSIHRPKLGVGLYVR